MSQDGRLLFHSDNQLRKLAHLSEDQEFARNRGGVVYWNGARANYIDGQDQAKFPPCCNVAFPKTGTARAARRYA